MILKDSLHALSVFILDHMHLTWNMDLEMAWLLLNIAGCYVWGFPYTDVESMADWITYLKFMTIHVLMLQFIYIANPL